jgi:hypothetical protein
MPEVFSCPKCQRKSRVPDNLMGQLVKCPGCGETFVADINPPANQEADRPADNLPRQQSRPEEGERGAPRSRHRRDEEDDDRGRRSRLDEEDDDRPRRGRFRRTGEDSTDGFGIASVILGGVSMGMVAFGCWCVASWFVAAPLAQVGGVLGIWARGGLQVAGLILNVLAFLPAVTLSVLLVLGVALNGVTPAGARGWRPTGPTPVPVAPMRPTPPRRR